MSFKDISLATRWENMTDAEQQAVSALHGMLREACENPERHANPVQFIEDCEFTLQGLWKFTRDANFHTWWLKTKGCTCPRMDNTDPMYFGGGKITVSDCPWHWKGKKNV
jgi:hypothetical protein